VVELRFEVIERAPILNGRYGTCREERVGVMLHYDASLSDEGAMAWFADPRCQVSYQWLVLDDGSCVRIAPDDKRAWHAGWCRTSDEVMLPYKDANSALYGVAVATTDGVDVTIQQTLTVAWLCRSYFALHQWSLADTHRIVSHSSEAVYPPGHAKAGKRGRKTDPEGSDPKNPILSVSDIRVLLPMVTP